MAHVKIESFPTTRNNVQASYEWSNIILKTSEYDSQPSIGRNGLFGTKFGVNLADHQVVLENIPEVRKTFNYLKNKIENTDNSK